ncbi:patatin-like phospholipase family protein [Marinomonas sp. C2222]|uniref:Patatin-like phospholipase family protein n=1 Tax=Marinomonas sargassi TaxID=2984494 RepID=A0ABT2YS92_9GAMM|nr:patatin-like phospholipase family protein [Marinomonas sargassi]MCV2402741.1 patatin-like phospholipase family protein [Marinomonas sargassi]
MKSNDALILSGGGARAAYQVGVLSAMGKILPENNKLPFSILCGTSAGALNATMLACHAHNFTKATSRLSHVWSHLTPDQVYSLDRWPMVSSLTKALLSLFHSHNNPSALALMDNSPLKALLSQNLDFTKIDKAIENQNLSALAITAMSYTTGKSTTFFKGRNGFDEWIKSRSHGIKQDLSVKHLLASSAIPMLFPAQKVGKHYYGDGAIRQKSAITPAIQLGAEKLFIIGVSGNRAPQKWTSEESVEEVTAPSLSQILGQLLNSAFIDNLEEDISQLELVNNLISELPEEKQLKQAKLPMNTLIVSPSEALNEIAHHYLHTLPKNIRVLLKAAGSSSTSKVSSAASYLLFTPPFCKALIELGYKDAMWEKDRILAFFKDELEE